MQSVSDPASPKQEPLLKQPLFSELIREVRKLSHLTQGQFTTVIGVSYVTVSRWQAGRIQPPELALHQVQTVVEPLSQSEMQPLQVRGKELLALYFAKRQK